MSEELIYSFFALDEVKKKRITLTRVISQSNMTEKKAEQFLSLTKGVTLLGEKEIDDVTVQLCEVTVKTRRVDWREWKSYYKSIFSGLNNPALILAHYDKNYYQIILPIYSLKRNYAVEDVLWSSWIDISDIQKIDVDFHKKMNAAWENGETVEQVYLEIDHAIDFHSNFMHRAYLSNDTEKWVNSMEAIRKEYEEIEKTFREM